MFNISANNTITLSTKQLEAIGLDVSVLTDKFDSQAQLTNIFNQGIAPDYSNTELSNPIQDEFPLVSWLLNDPLSVRMRNDISKNHASIYKNEECQWTIQLPFRVGTDVPPETTGACCWITPDVLACAATAPIDLLCIKDCLPILDRLVEEIRRAGSNDMTNPLWQRSGETDRAARRRWMRTWMAWYTARNIMLGIRGVETGNLKSFQGVLDILEQASVFHANGGNILGGFEMLGCRLDLLGPGNYRFFMHPLVLAGIRSNLRRGRDGELPMNWSVNGNQVSFMGYPLVADKLVPANITAGTGEVWMLEGNSIGAFMFTDLAPTDRFVRETFNSNDDPDQGCAEECIYMYNGGSVFNTNPNKLAVLTGVPIGSNCLGSALQGLDDILFPNTLVPMG